MRVLLAFLFLFAGVQEDSADAAKALVDSWERGAAAIDKLRWEWAKLRVRRAKTDAKMASTKSASGKSALAEKLVAIDAELDELDARLAAKELESARTLDAIGALKSAGAVEWYARSGLRQAKEPLLRGTMAMAVARSKEAGPDALIAALGASTKPEMAIPLLQALARHAASERAVPALVEFLGNRDWAVRVAAAFALAKTARPEGVEPVLVALRSAEPRSREQRELAAALTRYTGQNHGAFPDIWWKWWEAEKLNVLAGRVPLGKGARHAEAKDDQGTFYGIPQVEERIIYVVDISGSMAVSMSNPRWIDGEAVPARDDEDSRYDAALRELLRAIRKLRPRTTFGVVLYSSRVRPLTDAMLPASPANVARIEKELAYTGPAGSTNIYAALDFALRLAGVHRHMTGGKQVADAIYLLSDGAPTDAKGRTEDPERTLVAVREWNALGKIAIHTVGIGHQHSRGFLEALAEQNGGRYYAVGAK